MRKEAIGRSIEKFVIKPVKLVKENPETAVCLTIGELNLVMAGLMFAHGVDFIKPLAAVNTIFGIAANIYGGSEVVNRIISARRNKNVFPQTHQSTQ